MQGLHYGIKKMQIFYARLKTLLKTYFPHILKYDSVKHKQIISMAENFYINW